MLNTVLSTSASATGQGFELTNHEHREFMLIQASILYGSKGDLTADGAQVTPLTEAGSIVLRLSDYGLHTDDGSFPETTDYTVTFEVGDTNATVISKINTALGGHGTASGTTLSIENDKVGGASSTVEFVSTTNNALGDELGFTNSGGTATGTETAGTTSGTIVVEGRTSKRHPWVEINNYSTSQLEMVAICPEVRATATVSGGTGLALVDVFSSINPSSMVSNFTINS